MSCSKVERLRAVFLLTAILGSGPVVVYAIRPNLWEWTKFEAVISLLGSVLVLVVVTAFYRLEIEGTHREHLTYRGKFLLSERVLLDKIFLAFRTCSKNKGLTYFFGVTLALAVALTLQLPGNGQLFTFVYATLLFFQVLISRDLHLISLSGLERVKKGDLSDLDVQDGETVWKQSLQNIGTVPANNVKVHFRIFDKQGLPIHTKQSAALNDEAKSIEPGEEIDSRHALLRYELPDEMDGEKYFLRIIAQTGEGSSLVSDSDWRKLP